MTRDEIIDALRALEGDLRRRHVVHAGLFGSQARGDAHPDSDIDVVVQFDPSARITLWDLAGVKRFIAVLLKRRFRRDVDVANHGGLSPRLKARVDADAIYAF